MSSAGWWAPEPGAVPLAVWADGPETAGHVAVVLPPLGYAYSSAARLLTALLEGLAARGVQALLLDHRGTGDSFGQLTTQEQALADVTRLVACLVDAGAAVTVIGIEYGATLARAVRVPGVVSAVAVAPVSAGRRWVRQLQLLGERDPVSGTVSVGGYALPSAFLDDVAAASPADAPPYPLLEVRAGDTDLREGLSWTAPGLRAALETAAEDAEVDDGLVTSLADWVARSGPGGTARRAPLDLSPTVAADGVRETFARHGPHGLPGWLTTGDGDDRGLLVLLNSGSDPHTGPGRAWVDLARDLARAGGPAVLRVDARGWGRTPLTWGCGRPYDASMVEDCADLLAELRRAWDAVGVGGLCAGAWVALDVARRADVEQVVALNAQLYWEPGDPVEARIADTIARREPAALEIARDAAAGRWDREDAAGLRNRAGAWLDDLAARDARITLVFTGDDPGLRYLRDRLGARLADVQQRADIEIVRLPELDHGLQRTWLRHQLSEAVLASWRPTSRSAPAGRPR